MEHCTLCPRHCNARRTPEGGNGFCGLGSTLRFRRPRPAAEPSAPVLNEETGDLSELLLEAMNRANTLEEGDHE